MSIHNKRGNKPIPPVDTMKCPRVDGKKVKNNNRVDTIIPNIRVTIVHAWMIEGLLFICRGVRVKQKLRRISPRPRSLRPRLLTIM